MRTVTIILLGCCLLGFAGLVFVGNRMSTETARELARLEAEINDLKRQMADVSAAASSMPTSGTPTMTALASPVAASFDTGLIRAKETGRLYEGTFRIRSCPAGTLNVESDRVEGISVWCMKKK
jgi:hypothetical protein